jgi:transcriptional regulator with XRE-family HTH domain
MDLDRMILLGRRVAGKRTERGWTQEELAKRVPCSPTTISNLEQAKLPKFTASNLLKVADALDTSTDYLLGRISSSRPLDD